MEIRQIYYVLEIARQKSFSRAAKALYISQSNVSQQVRSLEEELQTQLFTRDTHTVKLTAEGEKFCRLAQDTVDSLDRLMAAFRQNTERKKAVLNIGLFPFYRSEGISPLVTDFYRTQHNVIGTISVVDNYDAFDKLADGSLDFAILKMRPESRRRDFQHTLLRKDHLEIIISRKSRLADLKAVRPADLAGIPLLTGDASTYLHEVMRGIYRQADVPCNVAFYNNFEIGILQEMIAADEGITFASSRAAQETVNDEVTTRPLQPPIVYNTYLVHPREKRPTGIYHSFVEYIVRGFHQLDSPRDKADGTRIIEKK